MAEDEEVLFLTLFGISLLKWAGFAWIRSQKKRLFQMVGHVTALYCYPVKSCKGITLKSAFCTRAGLRCSSGVYDRHWVITNHDGECISQKQYPKLVVVTVSCHGDSIQLDAPGKEPITLARRTAANKEDILKIRIMSQVAVGVDCGDEAAAWICDYLQADGLRLAYSAPELEKKDSSLYEKDWEHPALPGDICAYAKYCSYLLASEGSLEELNSRLDRHVTIRNFRPNIVIDGPPPFQEDSWTELRIGRNLHFRCLDACTRCPITTVNPDTGIRDEEKQPLDTLMKFRRLPQYGSRPSFGLNLAPDTEGEVNVGDPVYVLFR